jgi:hypothetical protein
MHFFGANIHIFFKYDWLLKKLTYNFFQDKIKFLRSWFWVIYLLKNN